MWPKLPSGALVESYLHSSKPEQLSFSLLPKYNFLRLTGVGRNRQNLIQAAVVLSLFMMLALGIKMDLARRRQRRHQ